MHVLKRTPTPLKIVILQTRKNKNPYQMINKQLELINKEKTEAKPEEQVFLKSFSLPFERKMRLPR